MVFVCVVNDELGVWSHGVQASCGAQASTADVGKSGRDIVRVHSRHRLVANVTRNFIGIDSSVVTLGGHLDAVIASADRWESVEHVFEFVAGDPDEDREALWSVAIAILLEC